MRFCFLVLLCGVSLAAALLACSTFGSDDSTSAPDMGGADASTIPMADGSSDAGGDADRHDDGGLSPDTSAAIIVTALQTPFGVAANDTNIFYTDQSRGVFVVPLAGGKATSIAMAPVGTPQTVAILGDVAYWVDNNRGFLNRWEGGAQTTASIAPFKSVALAATQNAVFVASTDADAGVVSGLSPATLQEIDGQSASTSSTLYDVAASDTHLAWLEKGPDNAIVIADFVSNTIMTTARLQQNDPRSIAVDESAAYWTAGSGAVMTRGHTAGAGSTSVASGEAKPQSIVADASGVYWITGGITANDGKIRAWDRKPGSAVRTVHAGFSPVLTLRARTLAVTTSSFVYLTAKGTVERVDR